MDHYFESNRILWDELATIHYKSKFYDVEGFKAGKLTFFSIERKELGDVAGKSFIALNVSFWNRYTIMGKTRSKSNRSRFFRKAIELAKALNKEMGTEENFIHAHIYNLSKILSGEFDIVFTSYGVLAWLPDLES